MITYKAHYKDEKHDIDIDITNTEEKGDSLFFEIDGVRFCGMALDEFELMSPEKYYIGALPFRLMKYGGDLRKDADGNEYRTSCYYILQRFELEIKIPVTVVRLSDSRDMDAYISLKYRYREHTETDRNNCITECDNERIFPDVYDHEDFSLHIGDETIKGKQTADFETALLSIYKQIKDRYEMRCCFTCQYSEYSPYGNCEFGSMMCYRKHKEEYLKVNSKASFFQYVDGLDYEQKQETHICKEFAPRNQCEGYRGYV